MLAGMPLSCRSAYLIPGAASGHDESEPSVQRRGVRVVDVDVQRDARLASDAHALYHLGDQPCADVLAPGLGYHAHLLDPAPGASRDEADIGAAQGREQRPVGAEVLII